MAMNAPNVSDLRGMVREVLREALTTRSRGAVAATINRVERVSIGDDGELAAFVAKLLTLVADPASAAAIRSGKLRFALARAEGSTASPSPPGDAVLDGVVTEQKIERLAGSSRVLLGPGAVLTPLARDRARRLGLKIERKR